MAYEILYARKQDLWNKLKEVKCSQLFRVCKMSKEKGGKINARAVVDLFFWFPFHKTLAL
jgi:hypothetical protein